MLAQFAFCICMLAGLPKFLKLCCFHNMLSLISVLNRVPNLGRSCGPCGLFEIARRPASCFERVCLTCEQVEDALPGLLVSGTNSSLDSGGSAMGTIISKVGREGFSRFCVVHKVGMLRLTMLENGKTCFWHI